jgi:hypothetical protein
MVKTISEADYIVNVAKSTLKSNDYIVENNKLIGALVGGIIITVDLTGKIDFNFKYCISNEQRDNILRMYSHITTFLNEGVSIYFNPSLREDPNFEQKINGKVREGAFNYFLTTDELQTVFITIYPGIFHLNKEDKISLNLKKYNKYPNILLADFEIFKKKLNLPYHIYFLFMTF